MNRMILAVGGVAAVVIVIAAAAFYFGNPNGSSVGGQPTPVPTPAPTPAPSANVLPFGESQVGPGRYSSVFQQYRYTLTVPTPGWVANPKSDAILLIKDLGEVDAFAAILIFGGANDLSTDACHWQGTNSVPGPTVEDFVTALGAVTGFEASVPVDVTVDGYHAQRIQLKVPDDTNLADCQNGEYHGIEGWYNFSPGQTHDVWVLDLDGTRSIFFTVYDADTPAAARDELTQVSNSLEIDPATP